MAAFDVILYHLKDDTIPCKTIPGEMRQVDVAGHPVLLCRDQGHLKVKATRILVVVKVNVLALGQTRWRYRIILHYIAYSHINGLKVVVQAYSSKCTHYGAPLASGHLEGGLIRW